MKKIIRQKTVRSAGIFLAICIAGMTSSGNAADTIRVACVGNSITYGTMAGRDTAAYPAQLQVMLGSGYTVQNAGVVGATLLINGNKPYMTFGVTEFKAALAFLPNIVTIKLGTNDSKAINWPAHGAEFVDDYKVFIDTFSHLSSHPSVWLCYPVPAYSTAYNIDSMVIHYEILPKIKTVALDKGVPLIDLFTLLSGMKSLFGDGIHPGADGCKIIAQKIYQMLMTQVPKIVRNGNTLTSPQGRLYQWYLQGNPVPSSSGGSAAALTVKDTGLYKVAFMPNADNDDMLVTEAVHITGPVSAMFLPGRQGLKDVTVTSGEVRLYTLDGRFVTSLRIHDGFSQQSLAGMIPSLPQAVYIASFWGKSLIVLKR